VQLSSQHAWLVQGGRVVDDEFIGSHAEDMMIPVPGVPRSMTDLDASASGAGVSGPEPAGGASPGESGPGPLEAGRYVLGSPIGRGPVGEVFRGYDRVLQRPVAVEVFAAGPAIGGGSAAGPRRVCWPGLIILVCSRPTTPVTTRTAGSW